MLFLYVLLTSLQAAASPDSAVLSYHAGVTQLQLQNFPAAIKHLQRAHRLAHGAPLVRSIELELGEAERRSGHYQTAMGYFRNLAPLGQTDTLETDTVAAQAQARAGQMAIEYRRYGEARALLQAQLWTNPTGEERDAALWGLGWIAFRTGDFCAAKNYFATLRAESPGGRWTPAATYWHARALGESGDDAAAQRTLTVLASSWPTDYYGYRAEQLLGAVVQSAAPTKPVAVRQLSAQQGFLQLIKAASLANQIDPDLVTAVIRQESMFNPKARSPVGALGLMQLMPATGKSLWREEKHPGNKVLNLFDPQVNVRLGTRLLARLVRSFSHQDEYALATYNAGTSAVMRWRTRQGELPTDIFVEEIPYSETRAYVKRVLAHRQVAKHLR